jgi:hypothetical protein
MAPGNAVSLRAGAANAYCAVPSEQLREAWPLSEIENLDVRSIKKDEKVGNKDARRLVQRAIPILLSVEMDGEQVCFVGNYS